MDLFTYLLGKNGKNSLVHKGDLFAYLLGSKKQKNAKTVSGTTINITDARHKKIESLLMTKESTQEGTPTPTNPVEVKTVKDNVEILITGKNLFNKNTITNSKRISVSTGNLGNNSSTFVTDYIKLKSNTTYHIKNLKTFGSSYYGLALYDENKEYVTGYTYNSLSIVDKTDFNISFSDTFTYVRFTFENATSDLDTAQIELGTVASEYEPYKESEITIPLNDNEICGIGDYKDELLVDKNGHCYINKKVGKVVLNGTEALRKASATDIDRFIWDIPEQQRLWIVDTNSLSNYFEYYTGNRIGSWRNNAGTQLVFNFSTGGTTTLDDFKTWLGTNNVVCYQPLVTSQLIDLNTTVDIKLFAGTNNISNSDNMFMVLKYY